MFVINFSQNYETYLHEYVGDEVSLYKDQLISVLGEIGSTSRSRIEKITISSATARSIEQNEWSFIKTFHLALLVVTVAFIGQ